MTVSVSGILAETWEKRCVSEVEWWRGAPAFSTSSPMGDFKKLHVWRKAHALALHVHRVATRMRGPQYAALRSQMIRAALSVPTNIVEGHGQASKRDFGRFLGYAINSTAELEYHLLAARDLGAIEQTEFVSLLAQLVEVRKMLHGLLTSLDRKRPSPTQMGPEKSD